MLQVDGGVGCYWAWFPARLSSSPLGLPIAITAAALALALARKLFHILEVVVFSLCRCLNEEIGKKQEAEIRSGSFL